MKIEKLKKVYVCCGQYIAPLSSYKGPIKCPRCDAILDKEIIFPIINIVKK